MIEKMDWLAQKKLKAKAFLRKYPNLKQAIGSYAYGHHHSGGQEETDSAAFSLAMDLQEALVKDGIATDATQEEFLQEVLEPNNAWW